MRRLLLLLVPLAALGAWLLLRPAAVEPPRWKTASIQRKDVRALVTSTGTVQPVTQVVVGTQVTGIVRELLVDFNDPVRAGQLLARIDTTPLQADRKSVV